MEYTITFDYFEIIYGDKDREYIELIIEELKDKYSDIMKFFNLEKLERNVSIKFWGNLDKYRAFFNERLKKYNTYIKSWETARSTINSNECRIDILCLDERRKCKGHQNDTVNNLIKVIIHEFVHICHFAYNGNSSSMIWFLEALATNLSKQFDYLCIDCSLEDILNGKAKYINYYSMGRYLLDNCDKDYILELSKNKKLLEDDSVNIYNFTVKYVCNGKKL